MRNRMIIVVLLSCLLMAGIDCKAQDHGRRHEHKERRELCLSDGKFAILYDKVRNASFDDRKMELIEVASLGAYYSCEQCAAILGIFSFGDKKLAALRFMAPRVTDLRHAYLIYGQFSFQSEKDEAMRIIGGCRD